MIDIFSISTNELVAKMRSGDISSVEVCKAYLERIKKYEKDVKAWSFLDKKILLEKAEEADEYRKSGKPLGSLHGLPIAIKDIIATYDMPTDGNLNGAVKTGQFADGYGYDVRALPRRNVLLTSSFTGLDNYMTNLGELMKSPEAMSNFGNTVVVWDLHSRKPKKILDVPGAPLEIRCAWGSENNYCFTTTALTSEIWLLYEKNNDWHAKKVADIADASKIPLPVDISISADDQSLWVNTWNDGMTRLFDISDPFSPKLKSETSIGEQVNMVSQSWDGKRLYYTSSLLANWDKTESTGKDLQYFKIYDYENGKLEHRLTIDFIAEELGYPHQMRFGAYSLYGMKAPTEQNKVVQRN